MLRGVRQQRGPGQLAAARGGGRPAGRVVRRHPGRASRCGWPSAPPTCSACAARPRAPGLDVSGLTGVIAVDPTTRTAEVQGMCTYEDLVDATLPHGLIPLVVPQLRTITLGRRGDRARHRVDQLPQRAAARVGARDGRLHRRRRGRHDPPRRRAVRRLPQLLRLARLRHPAAHRARARAGVRRPAPRPLRRRGPARQDHRGDRRHRRARGRAGRRARRRRVQPRRALPDAGALDRRRPHVHGRRAVRLRRPAGVLPLAAGARDRPADDATTTCGAGTPTGSGARARSVPRTRASAGCGRAGCAAPTST